MGLGDELGGQVIDLGNFLTGKLTDDVAERPWQSEMDMFADIPVAADIHAAAGSAMSGDEHVVREDLLWLEPVQRIQLFEASWSLAGHIARGVVHLKSAALVDELRVLARFPEFDRIIQGSVGVLKQHAGLMTQAVDTGNTQRYDTQADSLSAGVLRIGDLLTEQLDDAKALFTEPVAQQALDNIQAIAETRPQGERPQERIRIYEETDQELRQAMMTAFEPLIEQSDGVERGYKKLLNANGVPSDRELQRIRKNPNFSKAVGELAKKPGFNPKRAAEVVFFAGWHMAGLVRDNEAPVAQQLLGQALEDEAFFHWGFRDIGGRLEAVNIRVKTPTFRDRSLRDVVDLTATNWGVIEPILRRYADKNGALIREGILDQLGDVIKMRNVVSVPKGRRYVQEELTPDEIERRQLLRYQARLLYEGSQPLPTGFFGRSQRAASAQSEEFDPSKLTGIYRKQFNLHPERLAVAKALADAFRGRYYSEREVDLGRARLARLVFAVALGEHNQLVSEADAASDRVWVVAEPPEKDRSTLVHRGANWHEVLQLPIQDMLARGTRRLIHPTGSDRFRTMNGIVGALVERDMPERVAARALHRLRLNAEREEA